jgi:hypothetical protein
MATIQHPYSELVFEGHQLGFGDRVEKGDCYASTDGTWKSPGQSVGIRIESIKVVWVRPIQKPDPKQARLFYRAAVPAK